MSKEPQVLTYKGKPIVRNGNTIYYGDMSDKYIICLQIIDAKDVSGINVASKVLVQLQYTDPEIKTKDKVVKKSEKSGLYNAMDIASIWLERALSEK